MSVPPPVSGSYVNWQRLQDYGQGLGAVFAGQPFQVYRCSHTGDYVQSSNLIYPSYALMYEKLMGKELRGLETDIRAGTFWFKLSSDMTPLIVGDVFILNDPAYGQGANYVEFPTVQFVGIAFAGHGVLKSPIGARLDRFVQIYRAASGPDANGYWSTTKEKAQPVICTSGVWSLGVANVDVAAKIPVGFMADPRGRGKLYDKGSGDQPQATRMRIYVPPLNGGSGPFLLKENDIVVSQEGDRYRIVYPYQQQSGIVGSQLIADREVIQV